MKATLANVLPELPVGTTVGAYTEVRPDSGVPRPVGAALDTGVVAADGSLVFDNLPNRGTFAAAAEVAGAWRFVYFTTAHAEEESGGGGADAKGSVLYDEFAEEWPARPGNFASVEWWGPTEPPEMEDGDTWVETP